MHFYNSFSLSARRPARGGASENPEAGGETEAGGEWRTISAVAVHSPVWALYSSASQFSTICSRIIWYWWSLSSCGRVSLATGCQILLCSMTDLQSSSSVKKVCAVQFCEAVIHICASKDLGKRTWAHRVVQVRGMPYSFQAGSSGLHVATSPSSRSKNSCSAASLENCVVGDLSTRA